MNNSDDYYKFLLDLSPKDFTIDNALLYSYLGFRMVNDEFEFVFKNKKSNALKSIKLNAAGYYAAIFITNHLLINAPCLVHNSTHNKRLQWP